MFTTKNLIGRSIYETDDIICMEVVTKYDHVYLTQILVSKRTQKPYYDENWINDSIETSVIYLTRQDAKSEIKAGVAQYFKVRETLYKEIPHK